MKRIALCILLLTVLADCYGQLVRRKDYNAAFALQAGGETGLLTTFHHPKYHLSPAWGLKMTFPFTRKWFLGSEVNYSQLQYTVSGEEKPGEIAEHSGTKQWADFDLKQVQVPVYLKYMLGCNRASVLLGFYGSYVFDGGYRLASEGNSSSADYSDALESWNAGITFGYEHRIIKRLNIMCRFSVGLKEVTRGPKPWNDRLLPMQACITLSYDFLRIGDCDCD